MKRLEQALADDDLRTVSEAIGHTTPREVVELIERSPQRRAAVVFRLLPKDVALDVFEQLDAIVRGELILGLRDQQVATLFADLDPDDRVALVDELPATVARRLLQQLDPHERRLTNIVLGYPPGSTGRRMSPEYLHARHDQTVAQTLESVHARVHQVETIYTIPVTDSGRIVVGVVGLRDLIAAEPDTTVGDLMAAAEVARADQDAEEAARACVDQGFLALPVVDNERRLLGVLTVDDAHRILREAEEEDIARAGATEPLRRPYLSTPVLRIARSRVVWLLVLAVSAILTVQVLEIFEATLEQKVILALFIPLLTGTGGNTGSQAATTITRALAVGDVRPGDVGSVLLREIRVGALLGALLGALGFTVTWLVYDQPTGLVIGLTLLCVCTMAATVGGAMPLLAKAIGVDPAVFSTPFISTFCDATGLLLYFLIAKAVLGI